MEKNYTIRHKNVFECYFISAVLEYIVSMQLIYVVLLNQLGLQVKEVGLHSPDSKVGTTLVHSSRKTVGSTLVHSSRKMVSVRKLGTELPWHTVPGRWPLHVNLIQYYLGTQFQTDGLNV
jgi:hypothetical protein